ncbi:MAG TPA: LysO family transporter [Candidatus Coprenecus pullistercoris]|nr:LysO family transporter [Candidatus Coprenecus pullistercoris]
MFVVFGFMAAGVLTGWLMRRHRVRWTGKVMVVLIWLLLLILGVEVGSNRRIVESLPTLGAEAVVIAVVSLLGSCLAARLLWTVVRRRENASEKEDRR